MRNKRSILMGLALAGMFLLGSVGQALAVTQLPDPNIEIAPGETIASQHDDFYAYSAPLNTALGLSGYDFATGSGGLDLLLYTGGGVNNKNIGADGPDPGNQGDFTFPDALKAPGGSVTSFTSGNTWGVDTGTVTVDSLLDYMHATFGANINVPVFYFDDNQTKTPNPGEAAGAGEDLYLAGLIQIWDPTLNLGAGGEVAHWAFDQDGYPNTSNHAFEIPTAGTNGAPPWVYAIGHLVIPNVNYNGVIGTVDVHNNIGSGRADFIGIAPTMDLSQYYNKGYEFRATFYEDGLDNGYEELFLSGAFALPPPPVVPEPASMMLMGLGLVGLVRARKRIKA